MVKTQDTLILFQITMASTDEINICGVWDILCELPKTIKTICIVLTIPGDRADNNKNPQKAPASENLTIDKYKYTIKQYWLVFPNDDLLSIAILQQPWVITEGECKWKE